MTTHNDTDGQLIVIFGAGNIGRSFIGQIFGRSGYRVVFVDVDTALVKRLNRDHRYHVVHRHPDGSEERLIIPNVSAVDGNDKNAVGQYLGSARTVATAVGAAVLPRLLPLLTDEASRRIRNGEEPFDIILAENMHGAGDLVRASFERAAIDAGVPARYDRTRPTGNLPGVVECSVGKMVPIVSRERRTAEPTTVWAEGFNTLLVDADGWSGAVPDVPELRPVRPIAAWVDRKLYIHNLGHVACAYLGHQAMSEGTYIWEVVSRNDIAPAVRRVMSAAATGLRREYPAVFTSEDLDDHIEDLLRRFANRGLGDTIFRVGRDIHRKLGPRERVVGALRMLQKQNLDTTPVEAVYRAALGFHAVDGSGRPFPADEEFHRTLAETEDPAGVLAGISGFDVTGDRALLERLLQPM